MPAHEGVTRPLIGITLGDPAGIGPEIVLKALGHPEVFTWCRPVVYGQRQALERAAAWLPRSPRIRAGAGAREVLERADAVGADADGLGVVALVEVAGAFPPDVPVGQVSAAGGKAAFAYVEAAVRDAMEGTLDGIVTAPIHKEALHEAGIPFIGHTEMLAGLTGSAESYTMFMTGPLRIFFVTRHVSLRQACDLVTTERVLETARAADRFLRRLGIERPRLAVAALNPHASDGGLMGHEEQQAIIPAVETARREGLHVEGPVPADSVFHRAIQGHFDAVVSLYHDQGHIAAKTYDFDRTVSLTLGLPFLRTSVDHGTALDIAGTGKAREISMLEAIRVAAQYARPWRAGQAQGQAGRAARSSGGVYRHDR
ncbi:4-hydroxythreonine-4-phosphate dehydrogenase PdxA [Carboxydochorda subterranea]|uniref:4-hydroxythreonine-4-phosphate dehydrogenase PdxA n=1 Tax=Carboxydichorda subterranea TaxID=3109565 RepID=A0ABZ1BUV2_9FIRM|nr:4-hydroxythreonine-4-phosphate dehydrogenase PdxA [Limnochorda sp. L945t]WRP16547.1 4-hydroxythreonine-4-phosphate dehydrogenase PdxA [Limnochorda sp. L945t]